jgi:hypothetical protein
MYLPEVSGHSSSDYIVVQKKGTLTLPVLVKRTSTKAVKSIVDAIYQIYVKLTSPIEAIFTREYINDFAVIVLFAIGAGGVVKVVSNIVQKRRKKSVNTAEHKGLHEHAKESTSKS